MSYTNTPAEWVAYADEQRDMAMRRVDFADHPATSEPGRDDALIRAVDDAIRSGAYRAGSRGEYRRVDRWIGAMHAA